MEQQAARVVDADNAPAPKTGQQVALLADAGVMLLIWRHGARGARKMDVRLDGVLVPKPYMGARCEAGSIAVVALAKVERVAGLRVELIDPDGVKLVDQTDTPVLRLSALPDVLDEPSAVQGIVSRILANAPSSLAGWNESHRLKFVQLLRTGTANSTPVKAATPAASAGSGRSRAAPQPAAQQNQIVSRIDAVTGRLVTGWAVDLASPGKPVHLQFFVNGLPAGEAIASEISRDAGLPDAAQARAFSISLAEDAFQSPWREQHSLRVVDKASGRTLIAEWPIHFRRGDDVRAVRALHDRLEHIEQSLAELRALVPAARQAAMYSLGDYAAWYQSVYRDFHLLGLPDPAPGRVVPSFSIVIPLTAAMTLKVFESVLRSVVPQLADQHRFVIVNFDVHDTAYEVLANEYLSDQPRSLWIDARGRALSPVLQVIAGRPDAGYCLFLRAGEQLSTRALDWFSEAALRSGADLLYADDDAIDAQGHRGAPMLRPAWDPDLLRSTPYIGAFAVQTNLLQRLAVDTVNAPVAFWMYDLLLRAAAEVDSQSVCHIRRILTTISRLETPLPFDEESRRTLAVILNRSFQRAGMRADVLALQPVQPEGTGVASAGWVSRIRWQLPAKLPRVSIIVPTHNRLDLLLPCVQSLRTRTHYPDFEILIVDHDSDAPETRDWLLANDGVKGVRVLRYTGEFNWAAMNNHAAAQARGEILCFLNNDTVVLAEDWLDEMVGHAMRADVGAVGARLLFADGALQHGGIVAGAHGLAEHAFTGLSEGAPGYAQFARCVRQVAAVTGACLVTRRGVFESLAGFDAVRFPVTGNDVDYCLRLARSQLRVLWTPHAVLRHDAGQSRGVDDTPARAARYQNERDALLDAWGDVLRNDPACHPAFERYAHPYSALSVLSYPALPDVRRTAGEGR